MIDVAVATQCLTFVISKFPKECEVSISAMGSDGESYCIVLENLATLSLSVQKKLSNTYSYEVVFPPETTKKDACDFVDKNVRWKYWSSFSCYVKKKNKQVFRFGFGARKLHRMFNKQKNPAAPPPPKCTFYEFCILCNKFQGDGYIEFAIRPEGILIEKTNILRAILPKEIFEAAEKCSPPLPPLKLKHRPRLGLESGTDSEEEEEKEEEEQEKKKQKAENEEERKENIDVHNLKNCLLFKDPSELCKHFTDTFPKVFPTRVLLQTKFLQFIRENYGGIGFHWYESSDPSNPKLGINLIQGAEAMNRLHQQFVNESKMWPKSVVFNDYVETYKNLYDKEVLMMMGTVAKEAKEQI